MGSHFSVYLLIQMMLLLGHFYKIKEQNKQNNYVYIQEHFDMSKQKKNKDAISKIKIF